jgi:hypothetical protein
MGGPLMSILSITTEREKMPMKNPARPRLEPKVA